jgi:hypothetical protein
MCTFLRRPPRKHRKRHGGRGRGVRGPPRGGESGLEPRRRSSYPRLTCLPRRRRRPSRPRRSVQVRPQPSPSPPHYPPGGGRGPPSGSDQDQSRERERERDLNRLDLGQVPEHPRIRPTHAPPWWKGTPRPQPGRVPSPRLPRRSCSHDHPLDLPSRWRGAPRTSNPFTGTTSRRGLPRHWTVTTRI